LNYLELAFGGFNPQFDQDAAVKLALNVILLDERLSELASILTDGHEIGGLEGEPGWTIERRDTAHSGNMPGYANWPENARFRAYVDPRNFELGHANIFMDIELFHGYVRKAIEAYLVKNPSKVDIANLVISHLLRAI
jgi:hypothetical protein